MKTGSGTYICRGMFKSEVSVKRKMKTKRIAVLEAELTVPER
jgi:hypothetical protein